MKNMFIIKSIKLLSCMALVFTALNVNTMCVCIGHQPKVPVQAMRFKK